MFVIWTMGYIGGFTVTRARMYAWYDVPLEITLALFSAVAVCAGERMLLKVRGLQAFKGLRLLRVAALAAFAAMSVWRLDVARGKLRLEQQYMDDTHRAIGLWLHANGRREETVAVGDIGYIGWCSGLRVLDQAGLVSPEIRPFESPTSDFTKDLLQRFEPDYYVFRTDLCVPLDDGIRALFADAGYEHVARFPPKADTAEYGTVRGMKRAHYDLFRRRR